MCIRDSHRGFAARLLDRLLMLLPEPRGHIAHELVALAQFASDGSKALKTAALVLAAASTRAQLIARWHAVKNMTATGQQPAQANASHAVLAK